MLADSPTRWGLVFRVLHGGLAVRVALAVAAGFWLSDQSEAYGAARGDQQALF